MSTTRMSCPSCQGSDLSKRTYGGGVVGAVAIFAVLGALTLLVDRYSMARPVLAISLVFSFAAIFAAVFSFLFGRNRCKTCAHRWR